MNRTFGVQIHHVKADPDRPPMTLPEAKDLSQKIGSVKRAKRTINIAAAGIAKYEDHADIKSNSGLMINSALKCLANVEFWLRESLDSLESALKYAKEGR